MVDVFRASEHALGVAQEAVAMNPRPKVLWMQLGVRNDEAAKLAEANGIKVVMNRCPKIEYGRLSSEIAWMGVNTRTLTAQASRRCRRAASSGSRSTARRSPAARPTLRRGRRAPMVGFESSADQDATPMRVSSTNVSVASSMLRATRPRGAWI